MTRNKGRSHSWKRKLITYGGWILFIVQSFGLPNNIGNDLYQSVIKPGLKSVFADQFKVADSPCEAVICEQDFGNLTNWTNTETLTSKGGYLYPTLDRGYPGTVIYHRVPLPICGELKFISEYDGVVPNILIRTSYFQFLLGDGSAKRVVVKDSFDQQVRPEGYRYKYFPLTADIKAGTPIHTRLLWSYSESRHIFEISGEIKYTSRDGLSQEDVLPVFATPTFPLSQFAGMQLGLGMIDPNYTQQVYGKFISLLARGCI